MMGPELDKYIRALIKKFPEFPLQADLLKVVVLLDVLVAEHARVSRSKAQMFSKNVPPKSARIFVTTI